MPYVDGYILCVPRKNLKAYKRMATLGGKVWRDHGALDYKECVADDINVECGLPFTKLVKPKPGETIVFSYILYKNRAHRDKVNKAVMADKRLHMYMSKPMPFDIKRMTFGGFTVLVDAPAKRK